MTKNTEIVARIYDEIVEKEYFRLEQKLVNRIEFELTLDLIKEYIQPNDKVIDIGSGPGRYVEPLIDLNCSVGAIDLSGKAIEKIRATLNVDKRKNLLFAEKRCATELEGIPDLTFNIALMFGPLYHLTEKEERLQALAEARRTLKGNGKLIVTFLSTYPRLQKLLSGTHGEIKDHEYVESIIKGGVTYASGDNESLIPQHRCWPAEAKSLLDEAGFKVLRVRSLEGISTYSEDIDSCMGVSPEKEKQFLEVIKRTCEIPEIIGATIHYTIVAELK